MSDMTERLLKVHSQYIIQGEKIKDIKTALRKQEKTLTEIKAQIREIIPFSA